MTNIERAQEFMDYIHFNFGDTELDEKFLMGYFKTQDSNKEDYMELLWMSLRFLIQTDGEFKIYPNQLKENFGEAHNIAVTVLTVVEELINDNLFEFVPSRELLYRNDLHLAAELSEKIRKNPDYKLAPYEAMKVIEFLKGAGASYYTNNNTILSTAFIHNWKAFISEDGNKTYHKAIETLNEMLKIDGYTIIEAFDDNTKSDNDTKSKKTDEKTDCAIIRNKSEFIHSDFETRIRFHGDGLEDLEEAYSKINEAFYDPTSPKEIIKLMDDFLSKLKDHYPDVDLIQELNFNDYQIIFCGYNTVSHDNGIQFINNKRSVIVRSGRK